MITCDRCGESTAAVYEYHHGTATITLCYHHAQAHGPALTAQGWSAVTLPAADMYIRKNTQHTTQAWCSLILLAGVIVALVSAIAGCGNAAAAPKATRHAPKTTASYTTPPNFANEPKDGSADPALVAWFTRQHAPKVEVTLDASMTQTACDALNDGQSANQALAGINALDNARATLILRGVKVYCNNVLMQVGQ